MIFAALSESASRGELLLLDGGLCRFHRLKDGSITVREIVVLPVCRRKGVGKKLMSMVLSRADGRVVRARCPARDDYAAANAFWHGMAFTLVETTNGINLWERPCA